MNAIDVLRGLRKGALAEAWQDELRHLVDAVRDTGRKGQISLTLTIEPAGKGEETAVTITDRIATRLPQPKAGSTLMFITADGDLSRRDPRQHDLDEVLHEVDTRRTGT